MSKNKKHSEQAVALEKLAKALALAELNKNRSPLQRVSPLWWRNSGQL